MAKLIRKNLCSRSFSTQQIILFTTVAVQVALFQLAFSFRHSQNWLILILVLWRYVLMIFVVADVWNVTKKQPTDPLLTGEVQQNQVKPDKIVFCILCNHLVSKDSYHCYRCDRCALNLDHHCKYLNVCIGGYNYSAFLTLLASFILYNLATVILVVIQTDFWPKVVELVITVLLMGLSMALFGFHFYLNIILGKSTCDYLMWDGKAEDVEATDPTESERQYTDKDLKH